MTFIPASAPAFLLEGRFDEASPAGPVAIWQGSRIHLEFEGAGIELKFADAKGQNFFNAIVDGRTTLISLCEGKPAQGTLIDGLGKGRHRLTLFKRSEAAAGTVRFMGASLPRGANVFPAKKPQTTFRLQFFGDSITAGACNEDGTTDQWEDRRTHNNASSYAALTADALKADYRNIAVSGMGITTGWVEMKAHQIWDRTYPAPTSPGADLNRWIPDVLCVNLGENDDSFSKANHRDFPSADYTSGMMSLIQSIRTAYPSAQIVLLRGGMFGGAKSEPLRAAWEKAVAQLEAYDRRVSHFVFEHWSATHPRVADHRAMADELSAWLRHQPFVPTLTSP